MDLKEKVSGYQELKLVLSDMGRVGCKKINIEYDMLLKLFHEIQNLKYQKNMLLDEVHKLKSIELDQDAMVFLLIKDLLRDLKTRGAWIEYKNKTVHTKEYYRIEKDTLDKIVEEKATVKIDSKKLLEVMANLGILRKQGDKILSSATVEGTPKRIYMVRIDSVDFIE